MDDETFNALNLTRHTFHGEWNYVIRPQPKSWKWFLRAALPLSSTIRIKKLVNAYGSFAPMCGLAPVLKTA